MRTSLDVLRSTKKYLAELALPGYEVRLSSEEGSWERPFCRVGWSTPAVPSATGAWGLNTTRTLNVVVWPAEAASADEGVMVAEDVVERLTAAFSIGLHTPSYHGNRAHPMRVPIWDYAGKSFSEAVDDSDRGAQDFASVVEPPSFDHLEDQQTRLSRIVVGDVRLRWYRFTGVVSDAPLVDDAFFSPDAS